MFDEMSIVCFASCYAAALALEILRLVLNQRIRSLPIIALSLIGLLAHTIYLAHRATTETPLSSWYDWFLVAAWILAAAYLFLALRHRKSAFGIFLLPLVLLLAVIAATLADREPFPVNRAAAVWGAVHGILLLLGTVAVSIGFAAGVMYLVQAYRLKQKLPPTRGFTLPPLEWLQHLNARAIIASVVTLGPGILAGIILNLVIRPDDREWHVSWQDPTVVTSILTASWMVLAVAFEAFYKPARVGRKVAYLTVVSFLFLVLMLFVTLISDAGHTSRVARNGPRGSAARVVRVFEARSNGNPETSRHEAVWASERGEP